MINKSIDKITPEDIQLLIDNKTPESMTLEYKSKLPENSDESTKKFLAGVSAFANKFLKQRVGRNPCGFDSQR
ncbi:MAG: hypothetical protein DRP51_03065 [Candidatus Zixiibacteriota bacterium]|nr:MAG: hypothetical protein DRP51_03065 [candidate division Zixibacteria bacterium]